MRSSLPVLLTACALATSALADPALAEPATTGPAASVALPWTEPSGQGVAFGFDNGAFGDGFGQGLRVRVPFGHHWGLNVRALSVLDGEGDDFRWSAGGRVELFGQSPVYLNLVRLYGGGGPQVFHAFEGVEDPEPTFGGGGHFGFEFFLTPGFAFTIEVGGNGGGELVSGATIMGGMNVYAF